MKFIEVEYNQDLKPLETVLSAVKRAGDFFVSGAIEMPMPKVEVEGAGTLSFPVPDSQVATLIRQAERAPYGRGNETIVDVAVRKVWQIASAKIRIGGKSWPANFETIISKVSAGLGCEGICERFVRTIKEGCLDQMILFGEDSLRNAIREFVAHYHLERNHQGLDNRLIRSSNGAPDMTGTVRMRRRLGGMLNYYYCEAA